MLAQNRKIWYVRPYRAPPPSRERVPGMATAQPLLHRNPRGTLTRRTNTVEPRRSAARRAEERGYCRISRGCAERRPGGARQGRRVAAPTAATTASQRRALRRASGDTAPHRRRSAAGRVGGGGGERLSSHLPGNTQRGTTRDERAVVGRLT